MRPMTHATPGTTRRAARSAIRLVFIDVDGTLVGSSGTVHQTVWEAADRLRAAGVHLAVCTGRPGFGVTRALATRLDGDGWHVFQNGASIAHLGDGGSRAAGLSDETVDALLAQAQASGRALELYADDGYAYVAGRAEAVERAQRHASLIGEPYAPLRADAFARVPGTRIVRGQWMVAHDEVEAVLADPPPRARLVPSLSPLMPETTFVSVLDPQIDKVVGVRAVAEAYGVPLSAVMFAGDGGNDAAAMTAVGEAGGWPVAPANAEPEALERAHDVVGHVDDGGLADALDRALATLGAR